jgi:hypothetical protein
MPSKSSQKTGLRFLKTPKLNTWTEADNEITLFEEIICLGPCRLVSIDSMICAEISGLTSSDSNPSAYNTYRLYIDNVQVCQSGFEAETDELAPNLANSTLMWGGNISCKHSIIVKVTAQLTVTVPSESLVSSNVNNSVGNFQGSKGSALRVLTF